MPAPSLPPFDFQPLGRVIFGAGTLSELGEACRPFGGRALLVTDPGLNTVGHPRRAAESLRASSDSWPLMPISTGWVPRTGVAT